MEDVYDFHSIFNDKYSIETRKMVRAISENSRISISNLSIISGLSRRTTAMRLKKIEKELKVHYTFEPNIEALGFTAPHLILAKFKRKPDYKRIKELLASQYIPQVAATVSGKFDMLIYAVARSSKEYAHWDKSMQILLNEFEAEWRTSEVVHRQLGFFPIRNALIEKAAIPDKYKSMLVLLNENSRMRLKDLSEKLGVQFSTAKYNIEKMLKLKYVDRFTIAMEKPEWVSLMAFFSNYVPAKDYEKCSAKARKAFMSDDKDSIISRYIMTAPLVGSYSFFTLGVFDNYETAYKRDILYHKNVFKDNGIKMEFGEVKEVLLGYLPIRSIDTSRNYNIITWDAENIPK